MIELKCGTKIKWNEPYSLSIKEGIIVNEMHTYSGRTPDNKYGVRIDSYDVVESDTGFLYNVREKDITLVNIDGEWVGYPKSSGRYPWGDEATDLIKNYTESDIKATCDFIRNHREMRRKSSNKNCFEPKKVIFNGPATIVMWGDGTKTIVKRREGEPDDKEKAIMYCILKKLCGNKATMDRYLKLFLKEEESNEEKKEEAGSGKSDWKKPRAGSGSSESDL